MPCLDGGVEGKRRLWWMSHGTREAKTSRRRAEGDRIGETARGLRRWSREDEFEDLRGKIFLLSSVQDNPITAHTFFQKCTAKANCQSESIQKHSPHPQPAPAACSRIHSEIARWLGGEAVAVRGGVGEGRARLGGVAVGGEAAAEEERRWRYDGDGLRSFHFWRKCYRLGGVASISGDGGWSRPVEVEISDLAVMVRWMDWK
nr:hypothetical protein Iba_chr03bCG2620 [Ipomoea batatas]